MITQQVEIVRLNPMRVAVFHGFGREPEHEAIIKLLAWARPRGMVDGSRQRRIFGFNNPSPMAGSPNYGYEFWLELDEAEAAALEQSGEVEVKAFGGGIYAVSHCRGAQALPEAWHELVTWCENSSYAMNWGQCLEEHTGGALDGPIEELEFALYQAIVA